MDVTDADKIAPAGCIPPFSRQSNRPGIGAGVADDIASALLTHTGATMEDIPLHLKHGHNSRRPLGRYLRNRIRERIGIKKQDAVAHGLAKLQEKLSPLREIALRAEKGNREYTFKEELVTAYDNRRLQIVAKHKIYKQRKKL